MIGIGLYYQKIIEPLEGKIFVQNNYSKENIIEGEVGAAFSFSLAITNDVHMLDFNIIYISCQQCKRVEKLYINSIELVRFRDLLWWLFSILCSVLCINILFYLKNRRPNLLPYLLYFRSLIVLQSVHSLEHCN
jgi:hypothetical protein